ncbi:glycosyltransferase family 2 protein [Sulfitobacter albidus]|uniref:Glycosyltransferase family 2 protein n=1 Tax=Sulfitobacter albidus TaxID=2829501 RepID=A0A975JBT6_9RHOB|nr:glycosyltransferase family 2 protein [Sulfitobacter albidus]QUJ75225.1 glycosyltransferase family 2 protein [Sulfitobacter albidus]
MSRTSIFSRLRRKAAEALRGRRFRAAVEPLHGAGFDVPEGAVLAIVLVRNGGYHLDAFFDYYRRLGITHFAFLDNGSTDDTVARIEAQPGTVIDRVALPLAQYEDLMRAYPAQRYGAGRWCLYVDMDEQFDFEGRAEIGLPGLIAYLEGRGDTALMAQMLEMFPDVPLAEVADLSFDAALRAFRYYDVSTVDRFAYHSAQIEFSALMADNTVPTDALQFCFGGVRGRVFGEECCLTKHPLVFNGPDVRIAPHPHVSSGVRVSDFSAVIRHYKFAGDAAARDAAQAGTGALAHGEDAARLRVMGRDPRVTLYSDAAREWAGIEPLYDAGFLVRSDAYSAWVRR